jgi:hypothetical protein
MRVSGTVIWATDLQEQRQTQSQGKGRPKSVTYSYSASFAVALSGRQARRVGRIWADGKLLRGAAGDFKTQTGFRFYPGVEDQETDPLIAAAEGGSAPAYRGLCYAVFEDMALEEFGNRIPILSFELIAEDKITLGDIIAELGRGGIEAQCSDDVIGFVAAGGTIRDVLAPLLSLRGLDAVDGAGAIRVGRPGDDVQPIAATMLGARPGAQGGPILERAVRARAGRASLFRLGYADPARDFQPGEQRAELFTPGRSEAREAMVALDAATARRWALDALISLRARDEAAEISLPWAALDLAPGAAVALPATAGRWRVTALSVEEMRVSVRLCRLAAPPEVTPQAEPGRGQPAPDIAHGPTRLLLAELPGLETLMADRPVVVVAAAGPQPGWRRAALSASGDMGAHWTDIGTTAAPAVIGVAANALGPASAQTIDRASQLIVDLLHDEMALFSTDEDRLLASGNLMMAGRELLQFGRAERIGPARYRLTDLLRGRRGTEAEMAGHVVGEDVFSVTRETLVQLDLPVGAARWAVMAAGIGDATPVTRQIEIMGVASRPLSPVHLSAQRGPTGIRLCWIRRSRDGWDWPDGIETPLGEESERYRVQLTPDRGAALTEETGAAVFEIPAARLEDWRVAGAQRLDWEIVQLGKTGASLPARAQLLLG